MIKKMTWIILYCVAGCGSIAKESIREPSFFQCNHGLCTCWQDPICSPCLDIQTCKSSCLTSMAAKGGCIDCCIAKAGQQTIQCTNDCQAELNNCNNMCDLMWIEEQ